MGWGLTIAQCLMHRLEYLFELLIRHIRGQNDFTKVRFYKGTILQRYDFTKVRFYKGTILQRYDFTKVRFYKGTILQRYDFKKV
jgi:uncharacterized protein YpmB